MGFRGPRNFVVSELIPTPTRSTETISGKKRGQEDLTAGRKSEVLPSRGSQESATPQVNHSDRKAKKKFEEEERKG